MTSYQFFIFRVMYIRFFLSIALLCSFSILPASAAPKHKAVSNKSSQKEESNLDKGKKQEKEALKPAPTEAKNPYSSLPIDIDILASQALVMDAQTETVLLEAKAHEQMHPSSMTKIMTAYLAFKKIKEGSITPSTLVRVTEEGWRVEGSSMFLNINDEVPVLDLLKGLIIQSGNDASVILASHIAGSEADFAREMTREAKELGALETNFLNASGLPQEGHYSTAYDLAKISLRLMRDFPEEYKIFGEKEFSYGNIKQGNRNPLLYANMGCVCDGVKTGHSSIAGYGIVASCHDNGQRFIVVVNGLPSQQARADEIKKIMTWAMRNFTQETLFKAQDKVAELMVWYGQESKLPLTVDKNVVVTVPRIHARDISVKFIHPTSVKAPVVQGQELGKMIITIPTVNKSIEVPLVAAVSVNSVGFLGKVSDSLRYLIWGTKD